jgi:hypothetical protein
MHKFLYVKSFSRKLIGEMRNSYKILVGEPERKRPLGRRWCRWEDNIRLDLTDMGWKGVDWMHVA